MRCELGEIIISDGVKPRFTNAKLLAFTELYLIWLDEKYEESFYIETCEKCRIRSELAEGYIRHNIAKLHFEF